MHSVLGYQHLVSPARAHTSDSLADCSMSILLLSLRQVAPADVGLRRSLGDQDKWAPGTAAAATPSSAATFAAFAAEASQQDDVRAAAALAATAPSDRTPGSGSSGKGGSAGPKASASAAAAAFTAVAAAAAAAAVGGVQGDADVVREHGEGSPTGSGSGSASKGSAGKRMSKAGKGERLLARNAEGGGKKM